MTILSYVYAQIRLESAGLGAEMQNGKGLSFLKVKDDIEIGKSEVILLFKFRIDPLFATSFHKSTPKIASP